MIAYAILFDTRSIQRYIFSGNRLITNIGASYIVERLFEDVLLGQVAVKSRYGLESVDAASWKERQGETAASSFSSDCYVAYIGGGNALLLFQEAFKDVRQAIVTDFTKRLLVMYPGLRTGAAIGEIDLASPQSFQTGLSTMYKTLKDNQNTVFPIVNVPYTGLTIPCEVNGEAANFYDTKHLISREGPRFFSQEVRAKAEAAKKANEALHRQFADVVGAYQFPRELELLGQTEKENDIAIVHIDGNQMGKKFSACRTLGERSALSQKIKDNTVLAFRKLLKSIVREYESYAGTLALSGTYLPIRPLILGGDDITFICAAPVAVAYARRFITYLQDGDVYSMDSCGGIAILPTAYPFFRGYELAEQLCSEAKKKSRRREGTSWIDFAVLHGEQEPELAQIRRNEYTGVLGNMHFGPYRVDDDADRYGLGKLIECAEQFSALPQGKVKELRSVLARGEHEIRRYKEQFERAGRLAGYSFPHVDGWEKYETALWYGVGGAKRETPYVDAIEMIPYISFGKEES